MADFENGLARLGKHRIVHLIDPNPGRFEVYCHSVLKHRVSRLNPANNATGPTCFKCIDKGLRDNPASLDGYHSRELTQRRPDPA